MARACAETRPVETPAKRVDPVLAEERLSLEHHGRHAPMAGGLQCIMVPFHFGLNFIV